MGEERTREKTATVRKRSLSKNTRSFLYNSSVASQSGTVLHWLPTPAGRTEVLLRKEISSLLRQRHLNYFVVSRSPLGKAEVESSAGTSNEKVSCSITMKFSTSSNVLLIAILEMNVLPDMAAIGSSLPYICVINLLSPSLCIPAVLLLWINISVDNFHSPVGSCLLAIKAGIWK